MEAKGLIQAAYITRPRKAVSFVAMLGLAGGTLAAFTQQSAAPRQIDLNSVEVALRKYIVAPVQDACISQDYKGSFGYARYVSKCGETVSVTVVFGNVDDVRRFDLEPGKNRQLPFDIVEYANRNGSSWYTCPKGYYAVDTTGRPFKRPLNVYLCRESGS